MVDEFCELVRVNSLSGQEAAVAGVLEGKLRALGLEVEYDEAHLPIGGEVGNLIARLPATRPGLPTLMLQSHMDTVTPGRGIEPVVGADTITSAGDTILGADAKAGVVVVLEALREILAAGMEHGELQVVFCIAEETGLFGARYLDYSRVSPDLCFVFDGGCPAGRMTVGAPSAYKLTYQIRGRAAHAGVRPEAGVNAVAAAAAGISRMRLGRLDEESTANVGVISGGQARNIVPDLCTLEAEARSHDEGKLEQQVAHMELCLANAAAEAGAEFVVAERTLSYERFRLDPGERIVQIACRAAESVGLTPTTEIGGGGSDANIFNGRGLPAIICSTGAQQPHTLEERLDIAAMVDSARWLVAIVGEAAAGEGP
jgi:tripeptide aminopeptidase